MTAAADRTAGAGRRDTNIHWRDERNAAGRTVAAGHRRRVPAGSTPSAGRRVRRTENREPPPPPAPAPHAPERHEVHARQADIARQKVSAGRAHARTLTR